MPDSVTHNGTYFLSVCTSLTCVTIFESVTHIEGGFLSDCPSLTSTTTPDSVTHFKGNLVVLFLQFITISENVNNSILNYLHSYHADISKKLKELSLKIQRRKCNNN